MKKNKIMTIGAFLFMFALSASGSSLSNAPMVHQTTSQQVSEKLTVEDVLKKAESLNNKTIIVEGLCAHLCPHGGTKMFMKAANSKQTIRVEASKSLGKFDKGFTKKEVIITAKVMEQRIDETYLSNWEKSLSQGKKKHDSSSTSCESEAMARGENLKSPAVQRIDMFRKKIEQRKQSEGKAYLSFYYLEANNCSLK